MNRRLAALLLLATVAALACYAYWSRPVAVTIYPSESLTFDNSTRVYRIVVPHTLSESPAVVIAFHGTGDSTESMANYSQLDELASRFGFILVYPAAENSVWTVNGNSPEDFDANPDIRFFDHLLGLLSDRYEIDRHRIYAVGMSNGASFVQLLAFARPDEIAAIAAHSGPKPRNLGVSGNPTPIMLLVGEDDFVSSAMESDADQYRSAGHVVKFVLIPGLAHEWSPRHNTEIWKFLSQSF